MDTYFKNKQEKFPSIWMKHFFFTRSCGNRSASFLALASNNTFQSIEVLKDFKNSQENTCDGAFL